MSPTYSPHSSATTPRPARRFRRALAIGAVVSLAAACGGDDDTLEGAADDLSTDLSADDVEDAADDIADAADDIADDAESGAADLADVLQDNGLGSIATAVSAVDFGEITDTPEFTFFAPNDEAFTALTSDELTDLLAQPTEVADVLRNHTIGERVAAGDLTDGMELTTEAGNVLTVSIDGDTVMVGDATVVTTDVDVDDGVVHVVDALIVP